MNDNNKNNKLEYLADRILTSTYCNKTNKQKKLVLEVLSDDTIDAMSKANEICENLGIEKRGNRAIIYGIITGPSQQ